MERRQGRERSVGLRCDWEQGNGMDGMGMGMGCKGWEDTGWEWDGILRRKKREEPAGRDGLVGVCVSGVDRRDHDSLAVAPQRVS